MYVILVYDIETETKEGQKILTDVFKICKKYLHHVQKSVFEGELSEPKLRRLQMEIQRVVRKDRDSVIVFWSRREKWMHREFWGLQQDQTSNII